MLPNLVELNTFVGLKIHILMSKLAFATRSSDSNFVFSYKFLGLQVVSSVTYEADVAPITPAELR